MPSEVKKYSVIAAACGADGGGKMVRGRAGAVRRLDNHNCHEVRCGQQHAACSDWQFC